VVGVCDLAASPSDRERVCDMNSEIEWLRSRMCMCCSDLEKEGIAGLRCGQRYQNARTTNAKTWCWQHSNSAVVWNRICRTEISGT
jgi:hypothetical protein